MVELQAKRLGNDNIEAIRASLKPRHKSRYDVASVASEFLAGKAPPYSSRVLLFMLI